MDEIRNLLKLIQKQNESKQAIRTASQENWNALAFVDVLGELCDYCDKLEKRIDKLEKLHYQKGERI